MPSVVARLSKAGLLKDPPPPWLANNTMFEAVTGSEAYGCAEPGSSDIDLMGFCVPPKHIVFPHLDGYIPLFGEKPVLFEQYQEHHIQDAESRREYDVSIYSIVKFLSLCMDSNPNMVDTLFVPRRCIRHSTQMSEHVRENRWLFLNKGCFRRYRGYAFTQLSKMDKGVSRQNPRRQAAIEQYGFDTKFAYHIARLALECEQILETGDLILDRDSEVYKGIRNGEWSKNQIKEWFAQKEKHLEELCQSSDLPEQPDVARIRRVLLECLEMHYGSLAEAVRERSADEHLIDDLADVLNKHRPGVFTRHEPAPPEASEGPEPSMS